MLDQLSTRDKAGIVYDPCVAGRAVLLRQGNGSAIPTRWGVVVETPAYDVTIFKVHYGKMTLKTYTKGERVLRIEVILHNTMEYRWGRSLPCFPDIVLRLRGILDRFLNAVSCVSTCFVSDDTWEQLPELTRVGATKVGGIDLNKRRTRRVAPPCAISLLPLTSPLNYRQSRLHLLL